MQRNVKVKRLLKSTIFQPLTWLNKVIPKDDRIILLYSGNMGIRHNLKPLLEWLLDNKAYTKYKIVCAVENDKYKGTEEHVTYVTKLRAVSIFLKSRHVFYTTGQIPIKPSKSQIVIHMNHGTSDLKAVGALSNIHNGDDLYFTYMCAPSELYVPIVAKEYLCPLQNIKVCGEPMTDKLFNNKTQYNFGSYKKIILWLPTFRQSSYLNYNDSTEELLPMFQAKDYKELNEILNKLDFLLIVKLHTAQDTFSLDTTKYSNLYILTNEEFVSKNYDLYDLMPQADVLLGDYSSASLQFLLLDKPLAFVVPDMEEYKNSRGFCFENPEEYMPGPLIKEKSELYDFLREVGKGEDRFKQERKRVRDAIFKFQDNQNTKRVIELSEIQI